MRNLFAAIVNQAITDYTAPKGGEDVEEHRASARRFLFPESIKNDTISEEYARHSAFIFGQLDLDPVVVRAKLAEQLSHK